MVSSLVRWASRLFRSTPVGYPLYQSNPPPGIPINIPIEVQIEEELYRNHNLNDVYPVEPGTYSDGHPRLLAGRYLPLVKIGMGADSTVWLASDTRPRGLPWDPYVIIKFKNLEGDETRRDELGISNIIATTNKRHVGAGLVRSHIDIFETPGPYGLHQCLVYEPLRENLLQFRHHCLGKFPPSMTRIFLLHILFALDYLHAHCHVAHTELDESNILVTIEEGADAKSLLEDFVREQTSVPLAFKMTARHRRVYVSRSDFGDPRAWHGISPVIAGFGRAQVGSHLNYSPIQSDHYRAPEVIFGTGWTYSADIWNLGLLVWDMMEGKSLLGPLDSEGKRYDCPKHLARMIALFGDPPKELLDQERAVRHHLTWFVQSYNYKNESCTSAIEYFGGPYFNSNGEFLHKDLIPKDLNLNDRTPSLHGEDKKLFMEFVGKMLRWLPGERATARELLRDPWLIQEVPPELREQLLGDGELHL